MSLATPADPAAFSEQLPARVTFTVDRDTGAGLDAAVAEALRWTNLSPDQASRTIVAAVSAARAGEVLTVASVRLHVR